MFVFKTYQFEISIDNQFKLDYNQIKAYNIKKTTTTIFADSKNDIISVEIGVRYARLRATLVAYHSLQRNEYRAKLVLHIVQIKKQ